MSPITSLSSPLSIAPPSAPLLPAAAPGGAQQPFKNFLMESLGQVNSMQQDADRAVQQLITGGDVNPAEVLTTVQKADMSFRMMMQIRNKLVAAFQEVNSIRI